MSYVWSHPSLTLLEVLWRWAWGIPAIVLSYHFLSPIFVTAPVDWRTVQNVSLLDPLKAANTVGMAISAITPPLLALFKWLIPTLLLTWAIAQAIGRTIVLRRFDPALPSKPVTQFVLGLLRLAALAITFYLWWQIMLWSADYAVATPVAQNREPSLVLYCALIIIASMVIFVLWGIVSWIFSIAPLLAGLENLSPAAALQRSFHIGELRQKLVEINLVMGIVKIALIVLAMVFSATPLPFASVATDSFLHNWWAGVTVLYLLGSDFFHVTRTVAYIRLWRTLKPTQTT